jgi:SpoVK/Ycf46/Vps4 family AAA+-type ATPase
VLGTLLTWMEETEAPVFMVATANDIGSLRPELIRRFDEVFFVDLPSGPERAEIFTIHLSKRGLAAPEPESDEMRELVEATKAFTGAEIEKVVKGALMAAFADGKRDVQHADLLAAVAETVPLSRTMSAQIEEMREWASRARPASSRQESGHKVASGSRAMML